MTVKLNTAAATETATTLLLVMKALLEVTELDEVTEVLVAAEVLVVTEPVSSPMMLLPVGSARGDGQ
jgi:hypothetical protein